MTTMTEINTQQVMFPQVGKTGFLPFVFTLTCVRNANILKKQIGRFVYSWELLEEQQELDKAVRVRALGMEIATTCTPCVKA